MKKQMKILKDDRQIRTTIPKAFVKEFNVTKKDYVEWNNNNNKLTGKLKKDE